MGDRGSSLWVATGSAIVGVLIGGAAVWHGHQARIAARPPEIAIVERSPPEAALPTTPAVDPLLLQPQPGTLVGAVAGTRDTVVNLETPLGLGAGVIVDPHGIVLTNYHVIADALAPAPSFFMSDDRPATQLWARFANDRRVSAVVIVADPEEDLAVLRLQPEVEGETFAAARLGSSERLAVGQEVFAVGNPLGLPHSVSRGIVSALDRTHVLPNQQLSLIQLDASINLGNSGGPLFNLDGELVGIVTARRRQAEGIAFALPVDHVRGFLRAVVDPESARSGVIGVTLALEIPLPPEVHELGYAAGLPIDAVHEGLPAQAAGLLPGDTIVALRGKRLDGLPAPSVDRPEALATHLQAVVRAMYSGERLPLTVVRGRELVELALEVGSATARDQVFIDAEDLLGLMLDRAADAPRIAGARESSPLRRYGDVLRGTTVVRFAGREVTDVEALGGALAELRVLARKQGIAPSVLIGLRDESGNEQDFLLEVRTAS
jgi:S1-C subfamily serine protease